MKRLTLAFLLLLMPLAPVGWTGATCKNQQSTSLKTLGTLEAVTTQGVDTYFALVIKGVVSTNNVPTVSRDYNKFQGGLLIALDLVQNNTNALAPASLEQLSTDLLNEITLFRGGK